MNPLLKQVFSSGGGTQSTAIAVLILQGKLPKPDFCVIADTGREMPTTFTYFNRWTKPALDAFGVRCAIVTQHWCSDSAKGEFHASGSILIPAFSNQGGAYSKLPNFCTNEWKVRVVERFLRDQGLKRNEWVKWIGFSFDEPRRIQRMMQGEEYKRGLVRFPLMELQMKRQDSKKLVRDFGWPEPPRSRCWMCPNQSDREWAEVRVDWPEYWEKAVQLDESIRQRDAHAYLHSSVSPLRTASLEQHDDLFSGSCPSGECFL